MREPWQWEEEDIQTLIREQRSEDLQLDYKKSDSLAKTDPKKSEIAKDVSAMANSAGGVIIYGIDEQKNTRGPIRLDGGIDSSQISLEWLEQVIDSNIQRRIDGIKVNPVTMASTGRLVYVVWIPQSNRAPHMASDHRYYKRLGTTTAMMEEYEVRDVGRRLESPDLQLKLKAGAPPPHGAVHLEPEISNQSTEPVLYATCRLYVDQGLNVHLNLRSIRAWSRLDNIVLLWNGRDRIGFQVFRHPWSVPGHNPILEGEQYPMEPLIVSAQEDLSRAPDIARRYNIGWELRTPKAIPKLQGLYLTIDPRGPRFEPYTYTLSNP